MRGEDTSTPLEVETKNNMKNVIVLKSRYVLCTSVSIAIGRGSWFFQEIY